jgi:hypothetical protein
MLSLDTHILLLALSGELTARERRLLASNQWSISANVLWTIAKLSQLNRIELNMDSGRVDSTACGHPHLAAYA